MCVSVHPMIAHCVIIQTSQYILYVWYMMENSMSIHAPVYVPDLSQDVCRKCPLDNGIYSKKAYLLL